EHDLDQPHVCGPGGVDGTGVVARRHLPRHARRFAVLRVGRIGLSDRRYPALAATGSRGMVADTDRRVDHSVGSEGVRYVLLGSVSAPSCSFGFGEPWLAPIAAGVAIRLREHDAWPGCPGAPGDDRILRAGLRAAWRRVANSEFALYAGGCKHDSFGLVCVWSDHSGYALCAIHADQPRQREGSKDSVDLPHRREDFVGKNCRRFVYAFADRRYTVHLYTR